MDYTPGHFPKETPAAVIREFHAVSEGMGAPSPVIQFAPTAAEPVKPREGMTVRAVAPWDPGYGYGPYQYNATEWVPMFGASTADNGIIVACAGETSDIAVGLLRTFYLPYNVNITEVIADVVTAPTGSSAIFDVKISGASILSTKPQIEAGEFSSLDGTPAVVATANHSKGARVQIYADQVGSTVAGQGPKVTIVWRKVS